MTGERVRRLADSADDMATVIDTLIDLIQALTTIVTN